MSTSVTMEVDGTTVTLSRNEDEMKFDDFMRYMVEPAIIASGYSQALLEQWFTKGEL